VHAVWIANLFLYLVVAWWIFYRWRNQQPWTFFLFIFVLISPTILYLASIILFPPESAPDEFVDYKLTITLITGHSSSSLVYLRRSMSSIAC
jgi:hypothetical protein